MAYVYNPETDGYKLLRGFVYQIAKVITREGETITPDPNCMTRLVEGEVQADYIRNALDPVRLRELIHSADNLLRPLDPATIAVRGVSGLVFGAPLAYHMGIHLTVVRKDDGAHSPYMVEGYLPGSHDRWVIVDDLISTGSTIDHIVVTLGYRPGWLGCYLFNYDRFYSPEEVVKTWTSSILERLVEEYSSRTNKPLWA